MTHVRDRLQGLGQRAKQLRQEILALYVAYRDPRTPWYAKALAVLVVAYAFSPIDLIPDFIPILGYLDDVILLPLGIRATLALIPDEVMRDARTRVGDARHERSHWGRAMAVVIVVVWLVLIAGGVRLAWHCLK